MSWFGTFGDGIERGLVRDLLLPWTMNGRSTEDVSLRLQIKRIVLS
jgi:hypothetical protein